jgi:hypothetical protein
VQKLYPSAIEKGKAIPLQAWAGSEGSRRLRLLEFLDSQHMKMAAFTPKEDPWYSFLLEAVWTKGP